MSELKLTVNGNAVALDVEPRTSLADGLREGLHLTGTHLGCEQGACGACTVLVDGVPVRSCISNAATVEGSDVVTIEGFDIDPLMIDLRAAFTTHHALQCGFCTPGMLIMARDLIQRLPGADKDCIRLEMSGNLCRCTGYLGIVEAIQSVLESRKCGDLYSTDALPKEPGLGPAGSGNARSTLDAAPPHQPKPSGDATQSSVLQPLLAKMRDEPVIEPSVSQSFTLAFPIDQVADSFSNIPGMVSCIPGARFIRECPDGSFEIALKAKMGPISAEFAGLAEQEWTPATFTGLIKGIGRDKRSASIAKGAMTYSLLSVDQDNSTQVDVKIGYALSGLLGQFARGAIINQFVSAITSQFVRNVTLWISGSSNGQASPAQAELEIGNSLIIMIKAMLKNLFNVKKSR